ncbi:hypothetical protein [Dysgonomonas sp. BGC7]|uniref:hypothetical protein n=1 Tax=Dysgonomonas sp. BGC7 TaxID=1658008 RepID=UPI00068076D7|nr:hypothetical protein [Dysgonomonas sp. BGC7]MBD8387252.1 hypothetical protein [Dysgonomonas sp. BGC7]
MRKLILLFLFAAIFAAKSEAQVTIGSSNSPHSDALLDLKEEANGSSRKGLLFPRVALVSTDKPDPMINHVEGMIVYNTATTAYDPLIDMNIRVSPGLYYNDGTKWERLYMGYTNWFYMPSVSIPTGSVSTDWEYINLYERYKAQFTGEDPTTFKASNQAPSIVPYIPQAADLYYYITYYSKDVFEIDEISNTGVMKYKVIGAATDCSYINVVFVLR